MQCIIKRVVFEDERIMPVHTTLSWPDRLIPRPSKWFFPPEPCHFTQFTNYALGFRFEAAPHEMKIIQANNLFAHPALTLRDSEPPMTFAELLGPEFIPEVNPSQAQLLAVEAKVRQAAIAWTHFFGNVEALEMHD